MRVFRAKSALLWREPNQENESAGAVKASISGFSRMGSEAVRFFDASRLACLEPWSGRILGESGHQPLLSALPLRTQGDIDGPQIDVVLHDKGDNMEWQRDISLGGECFRLADLLRLVA